MDDILSIILDICRLNSFILFSTKTDLCSIEEGYVDIDPDGVYPFGSSVDSPLDPSRFNPTSSFKMDQINPDDYTHRIRKSFNDLSKNRRGYGRRSSKSISTHCISPYFFKNRLKFIDRFTLVLDLS